MVNTQETINKCGVFFGFSAAIGGSILAGIKSAIIRPENTSVHGIKFGSASCFINSLIYYCVITFARKVKAETQQNFKHSKSSIASPVVDFILGAIMALSNFNEMYMSHAVLGDKLKHVGDKNVNIHERFLVMLCIFFGILSASSGILFNLTAGKKIWQIIRRNATHDGAANQQLILNR